MAMNSNPENTMEDDRVADDAASGGLSTGKTGRLRWKAAAAIVLVCCLAAMIAWSVAPDRTILVIAMYYCVLSMIVGLTVWWLFFSGLKQSIRWTTAGTAVACCCVTYVAAIRQVDFDGDMVPRFRFRWDPSAEEVTQEWLEHNAPTATSADPSELPPFDIQPSDWSRFCGLNGDRIIREPRPNFDWDSSPPIEIWRHPVGQGWSSMSLSSGRLFTQEQRGPLECVVCYNSETGTEVWRHETETRYETAMGGIGPRATPTLSADGVFALGANGDLHCLNPETGEVNWHRNICEDAGSEVLEWAMSGSPLLYKQTIIVDAGGQQGRAVIAYNHDDGAIVWTSGSHKAGYAAPRIEQIDGLEQLLIFHGDGLQGLNPSTGVQLWEYPWTNMYKINVAQPMKFGNQVFISSGYDNGCVLIDPTQLTNGAPAEVWAPNKSIKLKFNEAVSRDNYVYGLDDGILACVEANTGKRMWKSGRYRFGQVLLWDDVLLVQAEKGYVAIVEAKPDKFNEIARFSALSGRSDGLQTKAWNVPAVHDGRLYIRDAYEMACYDLVRSEAP